jgi:hypothetical protein
VYVCSCSIYIYKKKSCLVLCPEKRFEYMNKTSSDRKSVLVLELCIGGPVERNCETILPVDFISIGYIQPWLHPTSFLEVYNV